MSWLFFYLAIGWAIRCIMVPVILRRQFTPGASMAWLGIVFLHPYIGVALYTLVGEVRLGRNAVRRHRDISAKYGAIANRDAQRHEFDLPEYYRPMVLQAAKVSGLPIVSGNTADFIGDSERFVTQLVSDIAAAKSQVQLLYYIFAPDASGRRVADAVIAAKKRGVDCRVMADAFASRSMFGFSGLAKEIKAAGVPVVASLPTAPLRRRDLRNHRKLGIIDGRIAYLGSQNLINADYGGRRGCPWYDLTARLTGPIVEQLQVVFAESWAFDTGENIEITPAAESANAPGANEGIPIQIVPTGPISQQETFRSIFLAAVQCARTDLIMTTPYFVPDQPTLVALTMAADRGVNVKLLLPNRPDHFFTAAAGRAHFGNLLDAGISIYLYRPGLLHSKTVTVDDAFSIVGSANLDVRSFNLNFELSGLYYGKEVTDRVRAVQLQYLADSTQIDPKVWARRSAVWQISDSAITLLSPLL
jgi:cardiolipin synthase